MGMLIDVISNKDHDYKMPNVAEYCWALCHWMAYTKSLYSYIYLSNLKF